MIKTAVFFAYHQVITIKTYFQYLRLANDKVLSYPFERSIKTWSKNYFDFLLKLKANSLDVFFTLSPSQWLSADWYLHLVNDAVLQLSTPVIASKCYFRHITSWYQVKHLSPYCELLPSSGISASPRWPNKASIITTATISKFHNKTTQK